jgi:hypothetical protein
MDRVVEEFIRKVLRDEGKPGQSSGQLDLADRRFAFERLSVSVSNSTR